MRDYRKEAVFFCGRDGAYMGLVKGKYGLYYRCENYCSENRTPGEAVCCNCMSIKDRQAILDGLAQLGKDGRLDTGTIGQARSIKYMVTDISEALIKIKVLNLKKYPKEGSAR